MSSREEILKTIRRQLPQATPLPDWSGDWIRYENPVEQFSQMLESVGGVAQVVPSIASIGEKLQDRLTPGKRVISTIAGIADPITNVADIVDPHTLADVELAILPGVWAIAENAAVWVQAQDLASRTLYFIAQHLVLVVPLSHVLNNLHEAYDRIDPAAAPFSCFISGPSKTADIEQSLVKGAHGARTLTVFLVDELPA